MSTLISNVFNPGQYNNYCIGGNLCNAFALGEIGSAVDFFIVGSEPSDESNYPMITANILDSEGEVLFRLVKNILVFNPGHCSKILGNHIGYEINDSSGKMIFKISTIFENNPKLGYECFMTSIEANFYNKNRKQVFQATSRNSLGKIETFCKSAFGFSGGFSLVAGYSMDELEMIKIALLTKGSVNQIFSGNHTDETIELDGKFVRNATLTNCQINIKEGDFILGPNNHFDSCKFNFIEKASQIFNLAKQLK